MDSILINTPVSSPLHPQLNLPLLKGFLTARGYSSKVIDSNILFFRELTGSGFPELNIDLCRREPFRILEYYTDLEREVAGKMAEYDSFRVGLRSLGMKYDRTSFDQVVEAVKDEASNPFISFYERLLKKEISPEKPKIICIGITFQDQIIPSFTLADSIRRYLPGSVIVFGGQMITRCYESMIAHKGLSRFYDYLVLWDGEVPLLRLHENIIDGKQNELLNIIASDGRPASIDRKASAPLSSEIPDPDFSDIDFRNYYFPDMLIPFQTTRGCYGKCAFCAIPSGACRYLKRSAEDIISDILRIQDETLKRYGKKARFFKFMEDTSSPELLYQISVEIEKRCPDVCWETFARLEEAFTREGFLDQLFRGGCRKIHWGLESSNPSILKSMNKKITVDATDRVLELSAGAGILNFCFVLVGFPGETDEMRKGLTDYIVTNRFIQTLTLATFDLTRKSPMEKNLTPDNPYGLDAIPAEGFQVRLPYTVNGENWKGEVIPKAHRMMLEIIRKRPDIGLMTLFPDQTRMIFCELFGNDWAMQLSENVGRKIIAEMLENAGRYVAGYTSGASLPEGMMPEPFVREHLRTKEDLKMIAGAVRLRKEYEARRIEQI